MTAELDDIDRALAEAVVATMAPDELPLLHQLMKRPTWRDRFQGTSLGYGIESDVAVVAPYVILTVAWVRSVVMDEAKQVTEKRLRALVRRLLRVPEDQQPVPPPPPTNRLDENAVREAVTEYVQTLGLKHEKARLLADAVVGRAFSDRSQ